MPRPAPKRNRSSKAKPAVAPEKVEDSHQSPEREPTLDPRHTLRSQTPLGTSYDQAIESSPTGDRLGTESRPGTGSRPPTRSRGYSSTLSFAGRKGDMSSRIPGTPGFESSVLSNFRRRPRQQSILQMMQAEDGSSDLDDEDFLGGLSPQDESTPLNLTRGKSLGDQSPSPSESLPSSGGSRKRKREDIQVLQSSIEEAPEVVQDSPSVTPVPRERPTRASEETPQPIPFPEVFSQTMALPASSSPPPPESTQCSVATARSPAVPHQSSKSIKLRDSAQLATATLRDRLLPRRRQPRRKPRAVGDSELPSDGESDDGMHAVASGDEDELSYLPSKIITSAPSTETRPLTTNLGQSNQKPKKTKAKPTPAPKPSEPQEPIRDMDKENELLLSSPSSSPLSSPPDSDASDSETETVSGHYLSAELRAAAKKFAEVDQWEMEFEEISASETQGSPGR
ncbi:hypothetical protein N7520_000356 [Penicillium odoratum]|uniref:uncharacterized protein n=1 Tax=Penicillium odoratum TaxID=1167516 RepID=UPI00254746A7|nr:uncharacterized protein N7520_000356 [Penicillium odoratum]KAJ5777110.1 hypothetical protein N7520_000356 [Penicillium odoratum]